MTRSSAPFYASGRTNDGRPSFPRPCWPKRFAAAGQTLPFTASSGSRATAITVVGVSAEDARDAGERIGRAGMGPEKTVDALIVASAVAAGAQHMLTGDSDDIRALSGADLTIVKI